MREIALDIETTGLQHETGHRIIELACVEIVDSAITGNVYHQFISPERDIDEAAVEVHGITNEFLEDKPVFKNITDDFLKFIGEDVLVAHNADFHVGFLNSELQRLSREPINMNHEVVNTLVIARKIFPGLKNNIENLCNRLDINVDNRISHGLILGTEIRADVYIKLKSLNKLE